MKLIPGFHTGFMLWPEEPSMAMLAIDTLWRDEKGVVFVEEGYTGENPGFSAHLLEGEWREDADGEVLKGSGFEFSFVPEKAPASPHWKSPGPEAALAYARGQNTVLEERLHLV